MASQVLSFLRPTRRGSDWTQQELAELYRIEHALLQARFSLETDRGVSDEGDPWFVFCRSDGEVLVHITRSDEGYFLFGMGLARPLAGRVIGDLSRSFVDQIPLNVPMRRPQGPQLYVHPAATLAIIVGMIFLANDDAAALVAGTDRETAQDGCINVGENASAKLVEPGDRVKASVLFVLGKLTDGGLLGNPRVENGHQEGAFLNIVCTIAAVMMGTSAVLDVVTDVAAAPPEAAPDAVIEGAQGHEASLDATVAAIAAQVNTSVGKAEFAETVLRLPVAAESDTPVIHPVAGDGAVVVQDLQKQVGATEAVAEFPSGKPGAPADLGMFGVPAAMLLNAEARPHSEVAPRSEASHLPAAPAPAPVIHVSAPAEASVAVSKEPAQDVLFAGERPQHAEVLPAFPDLFKSLGSLGDVQLVVQHATIDVIEIAFRTGDTAAGIVGGDPRQERAASDAGTVDLKSAGEPDKSNDSARDTPSVSNTAETHFDKFDVVARDILDRFFQSSPNAQAIVFEHTVLIFDRDDDFATRPAAVKFWELDNGTVVTLVGHADDLAVHV